MNRRMIFRANDRDLALLSTLCNWREVLPNHVRARAASDLLDTFDPTSVAHSSYGHFLAELLGLRWIPKEWDGAQIRRQVKERAAWLWFRHCALGCFGAYDKQFAKELEETDHE